jgi:predicted O-linked N-acetylglucosamine transferase (SPINDLY family)
MGAKEYDYILCDRIVIPEKEEEFYSEKLLYLNQSYLPFSPIVFDHRSYKKDFCLPDDAFILGSLNRIEKILPEIFEIWIKLLKKYSDTYLVLNVQNEIIQNNILNYCNINNFETKRIIFFNRVESHMDYLKRMSALDIYLDTYPYNGHTIIADSLFQSCVPIVTLNGKSFASRVSRSLLDTLNLNELSTNNIIEYRDKIEDLYLNRKKLDNIRNILINYKKNNLNKMKVFTEDFENILCNLVSK